MQRKLILAVFTLALFAIIGYNVHSQITPKPLKPFFVYTVQFSFVGLSDLPNQPQIPSVTASGEAIREDGSTAVISPSFLKDTYARNLAIYDFSAMKKTIIDDTAESTSTAALLHHDIALFKVVPKAHCGTPAGQLLGYYV